MTLPNSLNPAASASGMLAMGGGGVEERDAETEAEAGLRVGRGTPAGSGFYTRVKDSRSRKWRWSSPPSSCRFLLRAPDFFCVTTHGPPATSRVIKKY